MHSDRRNRCNFVKVNAALLKEYERVKARRVKVQATRKVIKAGCMIGSVRRRTIRCIAGGRLDDITIYCAVQF